MTDKDFLRISETYLSLQGEGSHVGLPCFFIRLAVCDIRCVWCDTPQALGTGPERSMQELLSEIPDQVRLVQITGGEPLVQIGRLLGFFEKLRAASKKILLETGGHRSLAEVPDYVHIVMDIKLPASGQAHHDFASNLQYLKPTDEIKFVIADRNDFEAALNWIRKHDLERVCGLLFSPVWGSVQAADLAKWILEESIDARMQVQLHKIIWGANAAGV